MTIKINISCLARNSKKEIKLMSFQIFCSYKPTENLPQSYWQFMKTGYFKSDVQLNIYLFKCHLTIVRAGCEINDFPMYFAIVFSYKSEYIMTDFGGWRMSWGDEWQTESVQPRDPFSLSAKSLCAESRGSFAASFSIRCNIGRF